MKHAGLNDTLRLRRALAAEELARSTDGCPETEELWASAAGELDADADEAIILHLARCTECSSIWRLAREMLLTDHVSESSVVPIGDRRPPRTWRRVLIAAAAAAILVGVGLSTGLLVRNKPSPPVFREQHGDQTLVAAPETRLLPRAACRLHWTGGPEGSRYDLTVSDGNFEILATVKGLTQPSYTLPQQEIPETAVELFWRVTARLPDGRTLSSETFTTRIDGRTDPRVRIKPPDIPSGS